MSNWYLVYCKARQEDIAAEGLEEQGYRVYLPKLQMRRRQRGVDLDVTKPLFPRYLFASPGNEGQSISPVQYTRGVAKMVRFGTVYLPVRPSIIAEIQSRADPESGFHRLSGEALRSGDPIRIASGPLAGVDAIFQAKSGQDRVTVLLELLGKETPAEIRIDELEL